MTSCQTVDDVQVDNHSDNKHRDIDHDKRPINHHCSSSKKRRSASSNNNNKCVKEPLRPKISTIPNRHHNKDVVSFFTKKKSKNLNNIFCIDLEENDKENHYQSSNRTNTLGDLKVDSSGGVNEVDEILVSNNEFKNFIYLD